MPDSSAEVVIGGAGIAGISLAYTLAVRHGLRDILLVDPRPPLSLTSDKSTECYRNWWPGPGDAMVRLMNRSIDLLEQLARESGNLINLNRRGYLYVTADPQRIDAWRMAAQESAALGAGPVRVHNPGGGAPPYVPAPAEGFDDQPTGADLIADQDVFRSHFPYLSPDTVAVLHARRCGWFSAQQLGMYMLERARDRGVKLLAAAVEGVALGEGRVKAVHLRGGQGPATIAAGVFVNAAGPLLGSVGAMIGLDLPVYSELHLKLAFADHLGVVPRHAPLLIWADPQRLPWTAEERADLAASEETRWMLDPFPAGVHMRPDGPPGSPIVLMLWDYHQQPVEPAIPPPLDPVFPELALRGLATMVPDLKSYLGRMPKPVLDGGYYTKTKENRPLIGPTPVRGAYVFGALSGYGLMAAPAAAELLAAHITGGPLPHYAPAFSLERYDDPAYRKWLQSWGDTGQL